MSIIDIIRPIGINAILFAYIKYKNLLKNQLFFHLHINKFKFYTKIIILLNNN